ncbi:hypothetical protein GA0111570_104123 [Raineyella antarctica]|uniref:DUF309 domain-containing protein n=1 Tax=Raineyella antarctica TaxID=1577474 RepID=A0A1G6GQ40_9ACTN|nr:DUF309 domain-containing protein [Raineyella antarctica]SDB83326.1 hypothetical protein GA0111570_104123 [Raineyella antarctica]
MTTRDRNAEGRPENARPRDGLGRPLPRGTSGIEKVEYRSRTAAEALDAAQDYLDREMPFHAHEVFEDQWKASDPAHRGLWQGLAQLAVGLTHQRRGNTHGAVAVTTRGADALEPYAAEEPYGIDVSALVSWARALASRPEGDVPVPRLLRGVYDAE